MKKTIFLIALAVLAIAGYLLWGKDSAIAPTGTDPYTGTLSGTIDCLQPKDPSLPTTAECRLALKTPAGEYYALNMQMMTMPYPTPVHGASFSATGLITPIENLSSDEWRKYNVKGIFSATGNVRQEASQ